MYNQKCLEYGIVGHFTRVCRKRKKAIRVTNVANIATNTSSSDEEGGVEVVNVKQTEVLRVMLEQTSMHNDYWWSTYTNNCCQRCLE